MNTEDLLYEQSLNQEQLESDDTEIIINETESPLESDITSVTTRIRNLSSEIMKGEGGTILLQEVFKKAVKESGVTERNKGMRSEQGIENTTRKIKPGFVPKSISEDTSVNLPSSSDQQSLSLLEENAPSLSLIDSSMKQLHSAMEKLLKEETENPERRNPLDTQRVNTAVKCAGEIAKLMKIKLEAVKLFRE